MSRKHIQNRSHEEDHDPEESDELPSSKPILRAQKKAQHHHEHHTNIAKKRKTRSTSQPEQGGDLKEGL